MTAARPLRRTTQTINLETFAQFLQTYVPIKENDVPFAYHVPRHPSFDVSTVSIKKAVFSITPTKGVYNALHKRPAGSGRGTTVAFIHRPFNLDRYRVPRRTAIVLSSHKSLDEVLTTGWNVQLAQRLGVPVDRSVCIQGYKGDPERRIGLVGPVDCSEHDILKAIHQEFGAWEGCFGFTAEVLDEQNINPLLDAPIRVVALMNAFHPEEIDRVVDSAISAGFITSTVDCNQILYLTGAVRQLGLDAALEKGMRVVCVGHKICEDWGIRFLAAQTRRQFPGLEVVEVDEPEEPRVFPPKVTETVSQPAVAPTPQTIHS